MVSVNLIKIAVVASILTTTLCSASSQSDTNPGARSIALGETGLGFRDINAVYTNPAGLQGLSTISIHANISRPFNIPELSQVQLAFGAPLTSADFLFGTIAAKGNSDFRQSRISIGYGRKLTKKLSVALEYESLFLFVRTYGSAFVFGYGISIQHQPFEQLIIGAHIRNPVPVTKESALIPKSTLSVGLTYIVSRLVSLGIEAFKDTQFNLRIKSGLEYQVHPVFAVRLGATTNPAQFHSGISWKAREELKIDFSVGYHTLLGVTPSIGISYSHTPTPSPLHLTIPKNVTFPQHNNQ